jgi:hypothetical protein
VGRVNESECPLVTDATPPSLFKEANIPLLEEPVTTSPIAVLSKVDPCFSQDLLLPFLITTDL